MGKYDCTNDVQEHRKLVQYRLYAITQALKSRGEHHDESKLNDPIEKAMFDEWTPELRTRVFGTDEYKQALDGMGEGVKLHYKSNRHHPEHYKNGVNGMTLVDLVEMVADWMAAAERRGTHVDLDNAAKRFDLAPQLVEIIANTLREEDAWDAINGGNPCNLCPPDRRAGHIEYLHPDEEVSK